jgi:hypothetical protein
MKGGYMTDTPKQASSEDLAKLRRIAEEWEVFTKQYGELHYQQKVVAIELKEVDEALDKLEKERRELVTKLQTELGSNGTIDLTTGEFIPDAQ